MAGNTKTSYLSTMGFRSTTRNVALMPGRRVEAVTVSGCMQTAGPIPDSTKHPSHPLQNYMGFRVGKTGGAGLPEIVQDGHKKGALRGASYGVSDTIYDVHPSLRVTAKHRRRATEVTAPNRTAVRMAGCARTSGPFDRDSSQLPTKPRIQKRNEIMSSLWPEDRREDHLYQYKYNVASSEVHQLPKPRLRTKRAVTMRTEEPHVTTTRRSMVSAVGKLRKQKTGTLEGGLY